MDDRRCFFHSVSFGNVNAISFAVPHEFDGGERMVPAKIHSAYARPVRWERPFIAGNLFFRDGEDATRT